MGSCSVGDEDLGQMVRDFIESDSSSTFPLSCSDHTACANPKHLLQDILLQPTSYENQVLEKVLMYVRNMGEPSRLKKWVVRRLLTDGYEASLCKSCWVSAFRRPKVWQFTEDYEYIEVMVTDETSSKGTRLIVDMDFKSQFEVARPTETYRELTNTLPSVFVGTEERLNKVISLLCSAAKQSLKEKGLHVPPWRKTKYMKSKWLSKNFNKVSVLPEFTVMDNDGSIVEETNGSTCCPSIF